MLVYIELKLWDDPSNLTARRAFVLVLFPDFLYFPFQLPPFISLRKDRGFLRCLPDLTRDLQCSFWHRMTLC